MQLDPEAVYVTAIKLMYGLSQQEWSTTVDLVRNHLNVVDQSDYNAIIYTNDSPPSTELTTGLAVRALYDVVNSMATQEPGFYKVASSIRLKGQAVGRILISRRLLTPTPLSSSDRNHSNTTTTVDHLGGYNIPSAITSLRADSGLIPDPDSDFFTIIYHYYGDNLHSQEVFSAMFAGLASVALFNNDGLCPWLTVVSASGNVIVRFSERPRQTLLGWHISRTLYLLVYRLFLMQRIFQVMRFTLLYHGRPIGDGFIKRMLSAEEAGALGLTASQ